MRQQWFLAAMVAVAVLGGVLRADAQTVLTDSVLTRLQGDPTNRVLLAQLKQDIAGATNREVKCRLGVIYCLGALACGETNEALRVRSQLLRSFPGNAEAAVLADASITTGCTHCVQGKVDTDCPKCKGTGACAYCRGTGRRTVQRVGASEEIKCPQCQGSGRCPECQGNHKVKADCPVCHGSGRAISPDKVGAAYAKALGILKPVP